MNQRQGWVSDVAACAALNRLGGELAGRGCRWELLRGGTAPWLLVSRLDVRKRGAVVIAWADFYWWPWGDHVAAYGEVIQAAERVAASLTALPGPGAAGDPA